MDASSMIGNDTFRNGEVVFRPGPIYQSAVDGGFCMKLSLFSTLYWISDARSTFRATIRFRYIRQLVLLLL